jgi:hypothetical protein
VQDKTDQGNKKDMIGLNTPCGMVVVMMMLLSRMGNGVKRLQE